MPFIYHTAQSGYKMLHHLEELAGMRADCPSAQHSHSASTQLKANEARKCIISFAHSQVRMVQIPAYALRKWPGAALLSQIQQA